MTIRCPNCQFDNRAGAIFCSQCGAPLSSRDPQGRLLPCTMLEGRYRLDQVLGAGGFGAIYLAEDTRLQRACVVKEMLVPPGASAQEVTDLRRNFEREARSLVALNQPGHPIIPEIYDFFSDPSGNYLVMKYIEGENLEELMAQQGGKLPWRQAVKHAIAVCDALDYMHSHQQGSVLHRDIKPANILVDQAGRTWLVDFGLSKAQPVAGTGTTKGTTAAGTPGYTPLEQWKMQAVPASDVYALGATLHHLVTGRDPRQPFATTFDLARIQREHGNFPPLRTLDAVLPAQLERLVAEAVKADPRQRPEASQWKQALEALVTPSKVARPFTFQSGDVARTPNDLVTLCDRFWDEARGYLYGGDFVRWFQRLNRNDLVARAQKTVSQHNDKDAGLEALLQALDPSLPKPQWGVAPKKLDFGSLGAHGKKALNLTIVQWGRGYVRVKAETKDRWLQVAPHEVGLKSGEQAALKVEVDAERMAVGTSGRGCLTLTGSDGRQERIVAQARVSTLNTLWDRHGIGISGGIIGGVAGLVVSGFLIAYCSLEVQEYVSASICVSLFFITVGVGGFVLGDFTYGCLLPPCVLVLQFLLAIVLDNLVGGKPLAIFAFNSMSLAFYGSLYAPGIVEKFRGGDK